MGGTPAPRGDGGEERWWQVVCGRTVLQELHRACEEASRGGHIPGGPALAWARGYAAAVASEQSCLNEWLAMADLESVRPSSPPPLRYAPPTSLLANQRCRWGGEPRGGAGGAGFVKGWSDWVGL